MPVYCDAAYHKGAGHDYCQDYATARQVEGARVAVISDGCSSAPDTDLGARALARSATWALGKNPGIGAWSLRNFIDRDGELIVRMLGAPPEALFATLLAAVHFPSSGYWRLTAFGDGLIGWKESNGWWEFRGIRTADDRPYYPAYEPRSWSGSAIVDSLSRSPDGDFRRGCFGGSAARNGLLEAQPDSGTDLAFVGSDGWSSFYHRGTRQPIPLERVLAELLPFHSTGPSFVRRRVAAFLRRAEKLDWQHHDDISLAAIRVDPEPEGAE